MDMTFDNSSAWPPLVKVSEIFILMFFTRFFLIKFVFKPLGLSRKMNPFKSIRPSPNHALEKIYVKYGFKATKRKEIVTAVARQEGMTVEEVKTWIVERNKYDEEPDLDKFSYECWESTYSVCFLTYAYLTLSKKSWFWDVGKIWRVTSIQKQDPDIALYACIVLAYYLLEALVLFLRKYERRDYYSMRIHHVCSVILTVLFWYYDILPFGCLILFYGDMVLPFTYTSRAAKRLQLPVLVCDLCLACFLVLWFTIRLFLAHYWFIPNYVNYRLQSENYSFGYLVFDLLIFSLVATNFLWSCVLGRRFVKVFFISNFRDLWRYWSTRFSERGG